MPHTSHGLGPWCVQRIELEFVTWSARTARAVRQTVLLDPLTPDDLERVGRAALLRFGRR